jgi:hypothetical protein
VIGEGLCLFYQQGIQKYGGKSVMEAEKMEMEVYLKAKLALEQDLSREVLLEQYHSLKRTKLTMERTKKLLAEVCFLLAKDFISRNEIEEARRYAEESIRLYEDLKIDSLERAVPELSRNLPEIMHEGVVKHQLSSLFQSHN